MNKNKQKDKKIQEDLRKLVIARINASSGDLRVAVGGQGTYSKEELIKSVEAGDELGQEIIKTQLEYLRDMAEGKIYSNE